MTAKTVRTFPTLWWSRNKWRVLPLYALHEEEFWWRVGTDKRLVCEILYRDFSIKNVKSPSLTAKEEEDVVVLLWNLSLLIRYVSKASNKAERKTNGSPWNEVIGLLSNTHQNTRLQLGVLIELFYWCKECSSTANFDSWFVSQSVMKH